MALRCARCAATLPEQSRFCLRCGAVVAGDSVAAPPADASSLELIQALQRELGGEISVRGEIGRDALTVAFAGTEARPGREVVVHVVPPELASRQRDQVQRLLRMARATAKLRHPRVAPVHRVAAGDRLCWYVTSPDAGETLGAIRERAGPIPLERTAAVLAQVAAALACAHEQGVVHGDLTPTSIILDASGDVSVKNFGLGQADAPASLASAPYRAPELDSVTAPAPAQSLSSITGMSAAADQYALAIVAWELLTGSLPFAGADVEMIRREHRVSPPPPLAALRPDLPAAVATVLERALAKRPADRFAGVGRFAQAFRAAAEGRPSGPARPVPRRQTESLLLAPDGGERPVGRSQQPRRSMMLGALGAATGLTILALLAWRGSADAEMSGTERARLEAASRAFEAASAVAALPDDPLVAAPPADSLTPAEPAAPTPAPAARPAARPRVQTPPRRRETRRATPAARPSPARGTAWVTVGTVPLSTVFINEALVRGNPVRNWPVPAGAVMLRFEVLDTATGVWTRDTVITLAAGDTLNLRRIRLARP